ncbi:hypothetical protein [Amycolatopsis rubida]|uniref:Uncharacterized protein n=1 Tax=Amycolatopsis rubida TaxID=112413 RepID=A0A1I6A4R2_9PSEU|nr:hypothetical protein [Amycolatopsis rubida]SFQ63615.1 hypothetical protein SAMN05421854_11798 [Amycolatopsis rubida]
MNRLMVFLDAIRDHLDSHALPPACSVEVTPESGPVRVQLDTCDLPGVARGLSVWASTLDGSRASLRRTGDGKRVLVSLTGRTPCGVPVRVYGGVPFDPAAFPDLPLRTDQDMPVWLLRQWARAGGEVA